MSDWSEKQFLALTAGIVGGILLIMAGVLFYIYKTYDDLVKETERVTLQVASLEKEAKRLPEVQKRLEDETLLKHSVDARVPEEESVEELIQQLNEQSRNAGLEIVSIKHDQPRTGRRRTKPQKYEPVKMIIECKGGFHELGQFINRIEDRMERLVAVSKFSIKGHKQGLDPGKNNLDIELDVVAYKFNNPYKKK
jgi:Tfp pilus assembly protein PilO